MNKIYQKAYHQARYWLEYYEATEGTIYEAVRPRKIKQYKRIIHFCRNKLSIRILELMNYRELWLKRGERFN